MAPDLTAPSDGAPQEECIGTNAVKYYGGFEGHTTRFCTVGVSRSVRGGGGVREVLGHGPGGFVRTPCGVRKYKQPTLTTRHALIYFVDLVDRALSRPGLEPGKWKIP